MNIDGDKRIVLRASQSDYHQAYVELVDHPHQLTECVHKTIRIQDLVEGYIGPGIAIDFDASNRPIGIEILYSYDDCEDES